MQNFPHDILGVVAWLVGTGKVLRGHWVRRSAPNWPLVQGTIEHAELYEQAEGSKKVPAVFLRYSYSVEGEFYGNSAVLSLHDEDRAFEFVHRAKNKPINVSVRPKRPEQSTITQEQLEITESALSRGIQPSIDEQTDFALPYAARSVLYVCMWTAALGVAVSVVLHLAALGGRVLVTPIVLLVFVFCSILLLLPSWLADAWLGRVQAHGRKSAPPPVGYAVYFFWIVSAGYYMAGEVLSRLSRPVGLVFQIQLLASLGAFSYANVLAAIYPTTQARRASKTPMAAATLATPKA
jgi:hypothetical protein